LLENSYERTKTTAPKKDSETVLEEDESHAKSATHSPGILPATEKVLSVQWNKEEDQMVLNLTDIVEDSSEEE